MENKKLEIIKKKAIEDHIPIIMDDTLEVVEKLLNNINASKILEIGTAVRIFSNMFLNRALPSVYGLWLQFLLLYLVSQVKFA